MRIVIMADGKGNRWNNHMHTTKHLAEINGEPIIKRTVRLIKTVEPNSEVIITSHDSRYEFRDSTRHEPEHNDLEIDRFTEELIEDNMCFLYGDTYYTQNAIETILQTKLNETCFFGNKDSIVGIRICSAAEFKKHKQIVRNAFLAGECDTCKGWQVYQSFTSQKLSRRTTIKERFRYIEDETADVNTAEDYTKLI